MIKVNIYYSIRKDRDGFPTIQLFAEEECAKIDQEIFKFWEKPCFGSIEWEVSGVAHMEAVTTREEYIKELKTFSDVPKNVIQDLQRLSLDKMQ